MIFLPQEIVNQFAFHIRSNRAALARARLVSRAWNAACVSHLFYHIEFEVFDPFGCTTGMGDCTKTAVAAETKRLQKRYNDILGLLIASPLLSYAIKEITIVRAHRLEPSAWGALEETYGAVLRQFKAVRTVRLKEVHFSHLSPGFVDALVAVCESGGVTQLEVLNCENGDLGNLTRIMRSLSSLQHLSLVLVHSTNTVDGKKDSRAIYPSSSSSASERGCLSPIRLSSLVVELSGVQTITDWLICSPPLLDLSRLKELRLRRADTRVHVRDTDMRILIGSCASSLELLDYGAPTRYCRIPEADLKGVFNLERFSQLRQIDFSGLRFSKDATVNLMPMIPAVLSTAVADSRLSVFAALANVESSRDGSNINWDCWAPVDQYLSDAKRFPYFERLDVVLVVRRRRYASAYVSLLKEKLWRLAATGRVRVSIQL